MPERRNLLADQSSPYLLQHRDNPVHWRPWGPPALNEAREAGKPILLSIGYAACHWCHVMAHESFENPEIADLMNELFVNIKVDREERPDIDQIYMAALQALGIQGGWPLTMFLTPQAEPVWGGTYFPPTPRFGRPSFPQVLRSVATLFREEGGRIEQNRSGLMGRLSEQPERGKAGFGRDDLDRAALKIATIFDQVRGGPRGAPKFPNASVLELLWRGADRIGSEDLRTPFLVTMERMCQGGIRDHVGGGFSRYSVDEHWLVPHFEKMLYDNAQLLELLVLAFSTTRRDLYRQAAIEIVEWLLNEMVTDEGAFAASLDADQDGEEGRFYVWTPSEIARVLDPDAASFVYRHFDVTEAGNFEGHSIPNRLGRPDFDDAEAAKWNGIRSLLVEARGRRTRPGRDDKVLADWNGLAIAALARSARAFARPDWLDPARRAFHFVAESMTRDGRIAHSWRAGKLTSPGFASDHAAMMRAALALHESGEGETLGHAVRFAESLEIFYRDDETGGYFLTASDASGLILRPRSALDEAIPNANGIAAEALLRLAGATGEERYRSRADEILIGLTPQIGANIFGHAALLNALDIRLAGTEIGIKGTGPAADDLYAAATALPFPTRIVRREGDAAAKATAILCIGNRCALPLEDPAALALTHRELRRGVGDA